MYDCLCRCINFLIFIYTGLYMCAWTTSLDHVHVCLPVHATWPYLTYSLGYFLTILDLHVHILKCNGSVVNPSVKTLDFFEEHRISRDSFLTCLP